MKISGSTPNYINQAYGNTDKKPLEQVPKTEKQASGDAYADSINLSGRTRDIEKISQAMDSRAVERSSHVDMIKEQVLSNQYEVDIEKVAEKMAGQILDQSI